MRKTEFGGGARYYMMVTPVFTLKHLALSLCTIKPGLIDVGFIYFLKLCDKN